jgi:hypothetical protein
VATNEVLTKEVDMALDKVLFIKKWAKTAINLAALFIKRLISPYFLS